MDIDSGGHCGNDDDNDTDDDDDQNKNVGGCGCHTGSLSDIGWLEASLIMLMINIRRRKSPKSKRL